MTLQLGKKLADVGLTVATLAAMYGTWTISKAAFGFQEKSAGQLIKELEAEDRIDRTRDSLSVVDRINIRYLTESNTILLCTLVSRSVKQNSMLPCKRLLRDRGVE